MRKRMLNHSHLCRAIVILICISCHVHHNQAQQPVTCRTPYRRQGLCVPIKECPYILKIQETYDNISIPSNLREFWTQSGCTASNLREMPSIVCCDTSYIRGFTSSTSIPEITRPTLTAVQSEIIFVSTTDNFESTLNRKGAELLSSQNCGKPSRNRVSGGKVVKLAEFPWMSLLIYDYPQQPFQCGGSLITNRYVLTAAHCIVGTANKLIGVRLGEHDIEKDEDCENRGENVICYRAEDYAVESLIVHPDYRKTRFNNDIAIIKLDRDVIFKKNIKPICLPVTNRAAQKTEYPSNYKLIGFGTTETKKTSSKLLKAEMLPRSRSYCQSNFTTVQIQNEHICAGGVNRIDSCKGDSGGPLFADVQYSLTYRYVLYGIVSFGVSGCGGQMSFPGVYANVAHFMPWITAKLSEN